MYFGPAPNDGRWRWSSSLNRRRRRYYYPTDPRIGCPVRATRSTSSPPYRFIRNTWTETTMSVTHSDPAHSGWRSDCQVSKPPDELPAAHARRARAAVGRGARARGLCRGPRPLSVAPPWPHALVAGCHPVPVPRPERTSSEDTTSTIVATTIFF